VPAIPFYTSMGSPPSDEDDEEDLTEPSGSEDGAGMFAAQPTRLLAGGLCWRCFRVPFIICI
jgi:hypothetical protein